jgi:hypothetical protein
MARHNTSKSSSEEVVEAPIVAAEEEDGSDIDGGNVDNFPTVPLPPGFEEDPEGSDSDSGTLITSSSFCQASLGCRAIRSPGSLHSRPSRSCLMTRRRMTMTRVRTLGRRHPPPLAVAGAAASSKTKSMLGVVH